MRYAKPQYKTKSNFSKKLTLCALILIVLSILKTTPDDMFIKAKNAVNLILTHHTEISEETKKIKDFFKKDSAISAMSPVSEFVNPTNGGVITKGFGVQDASSSSFHYGVDIKVENSQNITSCAKGEITEIATNSEYGSYILIKHSNEISTLYAHLGEIFPDIGATVEAGQAIARANSDDNTIHFEIKKGDTYLNPEDFIDFKTGGSND